MMTKNVCIICSNTESEDSLLMKSCTNLKCDAKAHAYCLVSEHKNGIKYCTECQCENDMERLKKFNSGKFFTTGLIIIYRVLCLLLIPVTSNLMAVGHDLSNISMLAKKDAVTHDGITLLLITVNSLNMVLILTYIRESLSYERHKNDNWFVISLLEWSNMNRTHCYALSIILICIPIFFLIIHSIGYITNVLFFGVYDFFGINSASVTMILFCIIMILVSIVSILIITIGPWIMAIPNAIHKIKSYVNQFYEVDTNCIHSHTI